jgi:hypothetical protein
VTTYLTAHFSLEELVASQSAARLGLDNSPPAPQLANLRRLAGTMELVRDLLGGHPVLISSGYRSPACNRAVGGAASSAHCQGLAIDFTVPGFGSPLEICRALEPHLAALEIDQLIHEFSAWCHLGLRAEAPRLMCLTINTGGTRHGF